MSHLALIASIAACLLLLGWASSVGSKLGELRERALRAREDRASLLQELARIEELRRGDPEGVEDFREEDLREEAEALRRSLPYARQVHHLRVERYNRAVRRFPALLIARIAGYDEIA